MLKKWEDLPKVMQTEAVKKYYDALDKKRFSLLCKRIFDLVFSLALLLVLSPVFVVLAVAICIDSPGGALFCQVRVTSCGKKFRIYKFRTMQKNADRLGTQVTTLGDSRVTRLGRLLRRCRLDELPQLLNILKGEMSFVGTRPEVPKYVSGYTRAMWATLLLPAGVTSTASIAYKDEDSLLADAEDADRAYMEDVLPGKMLYNLRYLLNFGFWGDIKIILQTVAAVFSR